MFSCVMQYSNPWQSMGVGDSYCVILGKTTSFKLLMGNIKLYESRQFWILSSLHCLKYLNLDIKLLHSGHEDDADSFHIGQLVLVIPYVFKFFSIQLFCPYIFHHFELHIVKTALAVSCWVRSCCTKCKSPHLQCIFHIL